MNSIGILGIVALLGGAWLLSSHRAQVRWRPIFWGLGLQFLFALIFLRQDGWSFLGMALLALLVVLFLLEPSVMERGGLSKRAAAVAVLAFAGGYGLSLLPGPALVTLILIAVAVLVVDTRASLLGTARNLVGAGLVVTGVAYLVSTRQYGSDVLELVSGKITAVLNLSDYGARFLFGNLADPAYFFVDGESPWPGFGFVFAFKVLPTIIFIGGVMGVLYYLGVMQKIVVAMGRFMRWTMGTSGAETLSCTANIFVGQTEAPLLIKPFLAGLTRSELTTVMVGGFSTIAGGVLAGFIAMGIPASHLIAATAMSAPAALLVGKILYPELETSETAGGADFPEMETGSNLIEAAANGITDGMKLALNIAAMLIGFIALIALADVMLNFADRFIDGRWLGGELVNYPSGGLSPVESEFDGFFPGSLQTLFGAVLGPLAFLMGVPWEDASKVGNLLGIKISLNELVAYGSLATYIQQEALSQRSRSRSPPTLCVGSPTSRPSAPRSEVLVLWRQSQQEGPGSS